MNNGRGIPYTLDGRSQCLKRWAEEFNIPLTSVRVRLAEGWDLRRALTAPRQGTGYRKPAPYDISAVWRQWITAPLVTENIVG